MLRGVARWTAWSYTTTYTGWMKQRDGGNEKAHGRACGRDAEGWRNGRHGREGVMKLREDQQWKSSAALRRMLRYIRTHVNPKIANVSAPLKRNIWRCVEAQWSFASTELRTITTLLLSPTKWLCILTLFVSKFSNHSGTEQKTCGGVFSSFVLQSWSCLSEIPMKEKEQDMFCL